MDFLKSRLYILIIMFVVMPINGIFISRGGYYTILGLVLFAAQIPWALQTIKSNEDITSHT